jgi:hypothetical protein
MTSGAISGLRSIGRLFFPALAVVALGAALDRFRFWITRIPRDESSFRILAL